MPKGRKPKKWLSDEMIDAMNAASSDELTANVMDALAKIAEVKATRKADSKLQNLKDDVAALNKGYAGAIKYEEAKIDFARELLEEKGKL